MKVTRIPFDSPEVDSMLSGANWKLLSPDEAAKLKDWLTRNSASRQAEQKDPFPFPVACAFCPYMSRFSAVLEPDELRWVICPQCGRSGGVHEQHADDAPNQAHP